MAKSQCQTYQSVTGSSLRPQRVQDTFSLGTIQLPGASEIEPSDFHGTVVNMSKNLKTLEINDPSAITD